MGITVDAFPLLVRRQCRKILCAPKDAAAYFLLDHPRVWEGAADGRRILFVRQLPRVTLLV